MRKHLKRLLSMLLVLTMVASFVVTGWAVDETGGSGSRTSGTGLEMEDLDPSTLHIPKLGEVTDERESVEPSTVSPNDIVRVSIFLDSPATLDAGYSMKGVGTNSAAINYRESLRRQQDSVTAAIERTLGSKLDVKWNMTLAVNAISAEVRYMDIPAISTVSGVKSVVLENLYEAPETEPAEPNTANTSENMTGATAAWEAGYTGAGSRIAIIDTGIDTTHQSFAAEPFTYSVGQAGATSELMTQAQIRNLASQLNSKSSNYISAKIPYGYNYVDKNTTINHLSDTQGEHGSHVAGIAAANRYIGSAHNDAASTVGAVGMAPDAQLFIMKVFGAGGGAADSDYMVAIEDAIVLDCDAANLSLGSSVQGWSFSEGYQDIMNNLVNKAHNEGMVVSISAGNSYDFAKLTGSANLYKDDVYYHTGGSPGSFINSLCVAAAQNTLTKGTPMNFNGKQDVYYYESTGNEEQGTTYSNPALTTIVGSYSYVYIDAPGEASDYSTVNSAVSLSGKIVIVNRGGISFVDKGENAKSYNPKAVIVANNTDGTIYMDLTDFTGTFPMVTITLKDANTIKADSTAKTTGGITYYTGTVQVTNTEKSVVIDRSQATITDFSSWGVPGSLIMKPEITAPGGDIYSVFGTNKTSSGTAGGSDKYESMSGTSMAAPHIAGLSAVMAEYLRENPVSERNTDLSANYSTRAIIQSLLMSTATPMAPENEYLSVLQQGAGLAEVSKAVQSPSVVMMTDEGNTLTVRTGSNADGKVKVELGDDPTKTGEYTFGFTVYNLTDKTLTYDLDTDLFTQKISGEFLARGTSMLPAGDVRYTWNGQAAISAESHDVNKDGKTDNDDVQAILDYLTDVRTEEELDLSVADMDGDGDITSYDAYLLIDWAPTGSGPATGYTVAPNGKAEVKVTIKLTAAQKAFLDENYANGAYLEGFTYLTCSDGSEHSIPILGFYGSWTDPSMFDNMSYVDGLYGAERIPYSGNADTNYLMVNYNGSNIKFSGNPYMVEDEFPADRLALSSNTNLIRISYNLIRAAATTGFAVTKLNDQHEVTDVVNSSVIANGVYGQYYSSSAGWQNTSTKLYSVNKTVSSYGLKENDMFRVGFYAIPEYNGMVVNNSYNAAESSALGDAGFKTLLKSNVLGNGAFVGYDFVVDNTAPTIDNAVLNGNTISVTASDNQNLAYVAVLSLDGTVKYAEKAPGTNTYTIDFDASDAIANAEGYVAVFAGDYAGNEAAKALKVNDKTHVEKTVYVLTNTLTAGNDYLIVSRNTAGTGAGLSYTTPTNTNATTATATVYNPTVKAGTSDTNNQPYIDSVDVPANGVWTAASGITLSNASGNRTWYIGRSGSNALTINTSPANRNWSYTNNRLRSGTSTRYLYYSGSAFITGTATTQVYLYQKTTISYDVDPYSVTAVTVTPTSLDLYKGNTADLIAKVTPLTATDRTVNWASSNTSVATVDANGHVTAVAAGTATITATSNADSTKKATCTVTVTAVNKNLNGVIWDAEGDVYFSSFNASSLPTWNKLHTNAVGTYLQNAYMADASTLYASTCDVNGDSVTYTVNRTTYALTEHGTNYVAPFGMARGLTGLSSNYGYNFFVYGFAKYLILGRLEKEEDGTYDDSGNFTGNGEYYVGMPYKLLDLSTTDVGDAYVCAVAARSVAAYSCSYYFLDETGKIWQVTSSYSSSSGFAFGTPTLVVDTGIGTSFMYQSLYYDGTYIYWSHCDGSVAELIIINPTSGKIYHAGNFGEGVWPAAGLYVNGSAAPASVEEPAEPMTQELKPVATRDELMTAEVMERMAAESAKFAPAEAPAYGGLNTFSGPINPIDPIKPVADDVNDISEPVIGDGNVTIDLIENVAAHNGLYTIEYDPDVLTYVKTTSNPAYSSINVDEEKGVITYAFADKETTFPAKTAIATVEFATSCEDTVITATTEEYNDVFEQSDDFGQDVTGVGHVWGDPTWTWATDYSTATASFVCQNNAEHTDEVEATVTKVVTNPTCEKDGTTVYTATVELDGKTYTDTKTVNADALGHDWNEPTYEWSADNKTVTAKRVCKNDATHVETETVETTAQETKPATCETKGETTYTATFTNAAFATQTKVVEDIDALGHDWNEPTYEWADDYSTVTAKRVCKNDATHVETETVDTTAQETKPATCETKGETTYTATFTNAAFATQTKVVENIDALGHDWNEPTYEWAADNSTVTATRVCANDATHVETETVNTTAVTTDATCEGKGQTVYTATFTNEAFETQTKTVEIPATGHNYGAAVYTWADDNSTVTAVIICKNDPDHTITETVNTTYAVVTEPTTETEGLACYTATFENELFEPQTKDVVLPKLDVEGYHIIVTDYTKTAATTSIVADQLYSGEVTFTVDCTKACVVAIVNGDGTYTRLSCTTEDGEHKFTVTVTDADVTIVVAILGDVNLDGRISTLDATMVKQNYLGTAFTIDPNLQALTADANKDGRISTVDATAIKQAYLGSFTIQW